MFAVDDVPFCVWDWDLRNRNLEFIDYIDFKYFEYLANTHLANIDGPDKQRAAIALRTGYHHALETLLTLLCATLQAPDCIVGWVQQCKTDNLRKLVKKINHGNKEIFNKLGLNIVSWDGISDCINQFSDNDERQKETSKLFKKLWHKFAHEYLEEMNINENNSIKHGFRTRSGGFKIAIGFEKEYCMPVPMEEMVQLGGSLFGTYFFTKEKIIKSSITKGKYHFRVRRCSLNWNPISMGYALCLISTSLNNIVSYLKIINGIDPKTVKFMRPKDDGIFDEPWKRPSPIISDSMDYIIDEKDIKCFSKDEIVSQLKSFLGKKDSQ